jgi:hypothetical protein
MRYRQKGFFVAAVLLMNLMSASLGMGLTIPKSESLAAFLPPAPNGWKADPMPYATPSSRKPGTKNSTTKIRRKAGVKQSELKGGFFDWLLWV